MIFHGFITNISIVFIFSMIILAILFCFASNMDLDILNPIACPKSRIVCVCAYLCLISFLNVASKHDLGILNPIPSKC